MELTKDISAEQLPIRPCSNASGQSLQHESSIENIASQLRLTKHEVETISDDALCQRLESILLEKISCGDKLALFQLGQLQFEQENYVKASEYFTQSADGGDFQAKFQLGVIAYDGLAGQAQHYEGFKLMREIASSCEKSAEHLVRAAQYNMGRAFFQGYGVRQSDDMAEKYWLLAADDGNPKASIKAQSTLGLFYCREDAADLKKAFFWHSEACGNGSLESQGALGVMHLNGLGTKINPDSAFICLREAARRGNVYAMGHLVAHYYKHKLYTKAMELAARVATFGDVQQIAKETDCLPAYIAKGMSLAAFYYARCLHLGLGIKKNEKEAKVYYSKSYQFDPDACALLQNNTQHGAL